MDSETLSPGHVPGYPLLRRVASTNREGLRELLSGCYNNLDRLQHDFRRETASEEWKEEFQIEHLMDEIDCPLPLDGWLGVLSTTIDEVKFQSHVRPVIALPEAVAQWLDYEIDRLDYVTGVGAPGSLEVIRDAYRLIRDLEKRGYPKSFEWIGDLKDDQYWDSQRTQVELQRVLSWVTNLPPSDVPSAIVTTLTSESVLDGDFSFKRDGEVWNIRYGSERASVNDMLGLQYLAVLLQKPGVHLAPGELQATASRLGESRSVVPRSDVRAGEQPSPSSAVKDLVVDEETIEACRDRLRQIDEELQYARESGDIEEIDKLDAERQQINAYLERSLNLRGAPRKSSGQKKSSYHSVKQAIERAIKKFERPAPALYEHLGASLIKENESHFEYSPVGDKPLWHIVL